MGYSNNNYVSRVADLHGSAYILFVLQAPTVLWYHLSDWPRSAAGPSRSQGLECGLWNELSEKGNMLPATCCLLPATKLLPVYVAVCCWIQRNTCWRDTGNMLPATSNMLRVSLSQPPVLTRRGYSAEQFRIYVKSVCIVYVCNFAQLCGWRFVPFKHYCS